MFNFIGNDTTNFSTSQIKIDSCRMENITEKGISGGEGSTLWVSNTVINKTSIGVASKDLSEVFLKNVQVTRASFGLVALDKKPEYGPGKIIAENLTMINCETKMLIEKESSVHLEGRLVIGKEKNVSDTFY